MSETFIPMERIEQTIFFIRGQKVILDADIALLYGVPTKALKQAVKRNIARFPEDFMFQLNAEEASNIFSIRSQHVTLEKSKHFKYLPYAFTEHGVAMLSSVLRSDRAIQVNIEIMRAFAKLRQMLSSHADLSRRLDALEKKYDHQFKIVFDAIRKLMEPPAKPTQKNRV